ncbi:cysteine hydrolase family protein [Aquabacterium sp. J223]|uniref:cysteine hydrolase family protein n=1 Tax=Aquabacterium sp. J223 TaxID=2898431 RepID=UPI0021AE0F52|nr:isochorismatase family cysteine hydrolase [Aquabacterium sp. J223]UUX96967.1 cysteine hydrolase [Aquabacterium sp. J223]
MPDTLLSVDARPGPFAFRRGRTALVVIDMQRDFLEPGGFGALLGNDVSQLDGVAARCAELLGWARSLGLKIVHTQEAHLADLSDCPPAKRARGGLACGIGDPGPLGRVLVAGEAGSDFVAECQPLPGETVLRKPGKGAFWATPLESELRWAGITHLLFAGVTTEVCVQTSMREANDRGFDSLIVTDCCGSYFPQFHATTIEMVVAQGGIVGWAAPLSALQAATRAAAPLAA